MVFAQINKRESIKYAKKYKATFNLINGNPNDRIAEWNFSEISKCLYNLRNT